jgi:tetratricopeptide (TPR) repeat protein
VAIELSNLAVLLHATNRLAEAEPLFRRALAIHEARYGSHHPTVATALNNLAGLLQATNRLMEAEPLFRRAIAIDSASYGPDHPDVAIDLNNLAGLLLRTNRLTDAEPFYRRATLILLRASKASGHWLINTVSVLQNYVYALIEAGGEPEDIAAVIAKLMIDEDIDPAELWPQVFGDDDAGLDDAVG